MTKLLFIRWRRYCWYDRGNSLSSSLLFSLNYRENNILERRHFNIKDGDVCMRYACAIAGGERERAGPMIPVDPGPRTLAPGPPMCRWSYHVVRLISPWKLDDAYFNLNCSKSFRPASSPSVALCRFGTAELSPNNIPH